MLNRREFAGSIFSSFVLRPHFRLGPDAATLRIGVVLVPGGEESRDASNGVALALTEAERSGALFGRHVELVEKRPNSIEASSVFELIRHRRVQLLIGGRFTRDAIAMRDAAQRAGIVFLNIGARDDSLRRDECRPAMYHIAASDSMIRSAATAAGQTGNSTVELWDGSLERYGAAQLNDRFRARFSRPMSSTAWAGWFAMKVAWEATLRSGNGTVADTLNRDSFQIDGHKGAPLSFRKWDHQLRQPVYMIAHSPRGGRVVAEIPDVGKDFAESMRDQLDRIGGGDTIPRCLNRT